MIKKTLAEFWDEFNPVKTVLLFYSNKFQFESRFDVVFSKFKDDIFTLSSVDYDDDYDGYVIYLRFIEEVKK